MELKTINISDILANFYQPRTKFDRESIKELSESILSNGLINPITITPDKKRKGKYMIVSGERRWQAHKVAGIKTIPCVVKTYSTDGQFMVESLIENLHREDLTPEETGRFLVKIKKEMGFATDKQLADFIKLDQRRVGEFLRFTENTSEKIKKAVREGKLGYSVVTSSLLQLDKKQQDNFADMALKSKEGIEEKFVRESVKEIKREERPEPIQYEETINDYVDEALSNLHNFKYAVDKMKKANLPDLSKSKADKAITTAGLHLKQFIYFVNTLRQRGAKPDKTILSLIRANGKN